MKYKTRVRKWFILNNDHYQLLPNLRWSTEVYRPLEDYTFKKSDWCFSWFIAFYWLNLSCGVGISGYLTKGIKNEI